MSGSVATHQDALSVGTEISVKKDWPEERGPCHIRTPSYVRGRKGRIEAYLGAHKNPEDLAFARPASLRRLYHVRFDFAELWPNERHDDGSLLVELYEHWISPLESRQ